MNKNVFQKSAEKVDWKCGQRFHEKGGADLH